MSNEPLSQDKINEIHIKLFQSFNEYELSIGQALGFLAITFVGTMAMSGYSDDFFDATVERLKIQFRDKKNEIIKENK